MEFKQKYDFRVIFGAGLITLGALSFAYGFGNRYSRSNVVLQHDSLEVVNEERKANHSFIELNSNGSRYWKNELEKIEDQIVEGNEQIEILERHPFYRKYLQERTNGIVLAPILLLTGQEWLG